MTAVSLARTSLAESVTEVSMRPRFEGSNICSWIGFKHVNYLIEEAVLEHFREAGLPARSLYEEHGLCVDITGIDTRISHAFHIDDRVTARVVPTRGDGELTCRVTLAVERDGAQVPAATATVRVLLRRDTRGGHTGDDPAGLGWCTVPRIGDGRAPGASGAGTGNENAFTWKWRIPYFYCHFTERLQMSGYLRLMEAVVDLFLADRGVSIRTLLDEQNWIPVVPRSAITMLGEAYMEEELCTVFTVEDIFKDLTYTARMDCHVMRDGIRVPVAAGHITHGYALIENRRDWRLVNFDPRLLAALRGAPAPAGQ